MSASPHRLKCPQERAHAPLGRARGMSGLRQDLGACRIPGGHARCMPSSSSRWRHFIEVGRRLKAVREAKGWSQAAAGREGKDGP